MATSDKILKSAMFIDEKYITMMPYHCLSVGIWLICNVSLSKLLSYKIICPKSLLIYGISCQWFVVTNFGKFDLDKLAYYDKVLGSS